MVKTNHTIQEKANKIVYVILFAFILIALRVWYLAIITHEKHKELARQPGVKVVNICPNRGTIRDRFNIPLAVNTIQYNAAICYEPIKRIPRRFRKQHIANLANLVGERLQVEPKMIEDVIYSKAALFPHSSLTIKENITEEEYYQLHILEKDWPGLVMQISSRRHYPMGKVGGSVLGYMGAISEKERLSIQSEQEELETFLEARTLGLPSVLPNGYANSGEVARRLTELKNKSYTINSRVGKTGIEGRFDDQLRGTLGKKKYEIDIKGNILRELPESMVAIPGRRFLLTISHELQAFAEELLMESESSREAHFAEAGKGHHLVSPPWIKGGAIVAMIPETGEIVALASYPRFDPNDFVAPKKNVEVMKWLEQPSYIAQIWDGIRPMEREFSSKREQMLTLNSYLDMVLELKSGVRKAIDHTSHVQDAIYLQNSIETLYKLSEADDMHHLIDALFPPEKGNILTFVQTGKEKRREIQDLLHQKTTLLDEIVREISPALSFAERNDDKILILDLLRLLVPSHLFDDKLLEQTGSESLSSYRAFNQATISIQKEMREILQEVFHKTDFAKWRETYFTAYLKEKRGEEKNEGKYQRPYLDYLGEVEQSLFETFFEENRWDFLSSFLSCNAPLNTQDARLPYFHALIEKGMGKCHETALLLKEHLSRLSPELVIPYLKTMRSFQELTRPLWGKYYFPAGSGKKAVEKDLARHFYPSPGYGYTRSFAFQENAPLGSIFKVITGYEGLRQYYEKHGSCQSPLTLIDQSPSYHEKLTKNTVFGYTLSGIPITRQYKGGRLPRSSHSNIGRVDLQGALERSSNLYFAVLAHDFFEKPTDLSRAAKQFGLGQKTGIDLGGEIPGLVPNDVEGNPTALYSFAIGQHTLAVTPLQVASAISSLVNEGKILKPQIVSTIANLEPSLERETLFNKEDFFYQGELANVGIHFPFFTAAEDKTKEPYVWKNEIEVKHELYLPPPIQSYLMNGLRDVVNSPFGTARPSIIRTLTENPGLRRTYKEIQETMSGKTSTAEILYRPCLNRSFDPLTAKHIWFAGISTLESKPDLVVIVYLRYGDHGKEAAPLAAALIHKWREIQSSHSQSQAF